MSLNTEDGGCPRGIPRTTPFGAPSGWRREEKWDPWGELS